MWIFLNDAFLSIVQPPEYRGKKPSPTLRVRARFKGDIERVFSKAKVTETPGRDYRYRADVSRSVVAEMLHGEIMGRLTYPNFKGSVSKRERWREQAYLGVWSVMAREQGRRHPIEREDLFGAKWPPLDNEGDPDGDYLPEPV